MTRPDRQQLQTTSWLAVVRAYNECTRRYARLLACFDLTIPQFDAMTAIRALGDDATPHAIADRLLVTRGNVTGVLRRLKEGELISTRHNERDGRSFVCRLTRAGRQRMGRARAAAALFIEAQLAPFDDGELENTERQMTRMYEHLQRVDPEGLADEARTVTRKKGSRK